MSKERLEEINQRIKDGSIEVVDVKSEGTITQVFRIKEKLFNAKYPHKLTLVKWQNGRFVEL